MSILVKYLPLTDYEVCFDAMKQFNESRTSKTEDEIWFVETDRGGQVTYHGPGQMVCYLLLDMKRNKLSVKGLVNKIEQSIIDFLGQFNLQAQRIKNAPGVYIDGKKIAALGIRIRRGCTYHGLALNVDMDLTPFKRIDPCGYPDLEVIQLCDMASDIDMARCIEQFLPHLLHNLDYDTYNTQDNTEDQPTSVV
jgi:lipoyl(octanoyl) transferase